MLHCMPVKHDPPFDSSELSIGRHEIKMREGQRKESPNSSVHQLIDWKRVTAFFFMVLLR